MIVPLYTGGHLRAQAAPSDAPILGAAMQSMSKEKAHMTSITSHIQPGLDAKKIPTALVVAFLLQTAGALFWAGSAADRSPAASSPAPSCPLCGG